MTASYRESTSPELLHAGPEDFTRANVFATWKSAEFRFRALTLDGHLWVVIEKPGTPPLAMRLIYGSHGELAVNHIEDENGSRRIEASSEAGAFRVTIESATRDELTRLHCTTSFIPMHDLRMPVHSRDLVIVEPLGEGAKTGGRLYSSQHGYQTGSLFGACSGGAGSSFYYFQNFSSLSKYFDDTKTTPRETVGGAWPEIGFLLPVSEDHPLLASNEYVLSDAYLVLRAKEPANEGEVARFYLDSLAEVASVLPAPPRSYRDWIGGAWKTAYDLSHAPECAMVVGGRRYLAPYVGTNNKPPESMVQLTVLAALAEFETWTGATFSLTKELLRGLDAFVDDEIGSIVRWLPGERFKEREDEHQTHRAMDSWYLYHVLFNIARLAAAGHNDARRILSDSLPYAIRVAKRFAYRWPIFFDLKTLDVIQAEARKGSGGENDVSGLYALLMLHAYEIFGDAGHVDEAKRAAAAMQGFGFALTYQTNTTGFAAEAALRLWKLTDDRRYFDLSMVALANVFDNMSLWHATYGNARWYSTYFGLYPLRGAPYIAAYEETEALAKFHEFLRLGGDDLPPSVTLLVSEFAKWLLSRGWHYYPGELPAQMLSDTPRNGTIRRELFIPLEDLQDGLEPSGQVGQEIYGAGLALVCATRHFRRIAGRPYVLFCEYPLEECAKRSYRVIGDPRMHCSVRLIPVGANATIAEDEIRIRGNKRCRTHRSVEGHVTLDVRGGDILELASKRTGARKARLDK